jgi:hypothetical protein
MDSEQDIPDDINENDLVTPAETVISRNNSFDDVVRGRVHSIMLSSGRRDKYISNVAA